MTNPDGSFKTDRIIISRSSSYPKIFTLKVIGTELVNSFIPIFDLDYSKSVETDKVSQIIGAVSVFKIDPELYTKIVSNSDLSDMNVVLDSSKTLYGIIKRFLLTNPENMTNTLNEVMAYVDTYVKTQLAKYNITDDAFVTDINIAMFLMFAGKQKLYQPGVSDFIINQSKNKIPADQIAPSQQKPEKKSWFSFFKKSGQTKEVKKSEDEKKTSSRIYRKDSDIEKEEEAIEKEIEKLEKKIGKPGKTGFWHAVWERWKEDAWESLDERERRLELQRKEIENKLKLEKEKLDLIAYKKKLRNSNKKSDASSDNDAETADEED
jgi:hypothetical protein